MAIEDNDMDAFIRDTLNSYQRVREKNFVPVQQTILSRASTTIAGEPLALSPTVTITGGGIFGGGGLNPLQIVAVSETEITITTGVVNYDNYPTISGIPISNDPKPVIAIGSASYIWIKCVGTFGSTDSYVVTIERTGSSTPPSASTITGTGFTSCFLIGTVEVADSKISAITNIFSGGNLGVESFGSTNMWWAT